MSRLPPARVISAAEPLPDHSGPRYRVRARLGRGGSADVYHVLEIGSARELALKRLRNDLNPARVAELAMQLSERSERDSA